MGNDLSNYMKSATRDIQAEYDRIQKRAQEDPGTAGDNGEENWAQLLREWLPASYHIVTKGRIMNTEGNCGPQVDVLVLSPTYPPVLLKKKEYLEGGVIAAFECKLTLTAAHVRDAVMKAAEIRNLSRPKREGTPYKELYTRLRYGILAHSHSWKNKNSDPIKNINKGLYEEELKKAQNPKDVLDFICVSDLAAWHTRKMVFAGNKLLSQIRPRYEAKDAWSSFQVAGGVIESTHICSTSKSFIDGTTQESFTPVGSFLTSLFESLSWEDESMRYLSEYFSGAGLAGPGQGSGICWPLSILSSGLASQLKQGGKLATGGRWNEWNMIL